SIPWDGAQKEFTYSPLPSLLATLDLVYHRLVRLCEVQKGITMPKTPNIKRLARNQYHVQVSRTDPQTGRRVFRRKHVEGSHADAVIVRDQLIAKLESEIASEFQPEMTLTEYVQRWLKARASKLKPSTMAKYVNDLEKHILPKIGERPIGTLRPRDIELMLSKDRGAPNSKKNRLCTLRAISKDALADYVIERDFCARVNVPVPPIYSKDNPNLLTGPQVARVLPEIPRHWLDLACMMTYTGLRWGEVSAIHWDDIDLETRIVDIRWTNWKGLLQTPKNKRAFRTIPLADPLPQMLAERRQWMLANQHPGLTNGLVFPTNAGTAHRGTPLGRVLREACERAGVTIRLTPHGLRRTWNNIARMHADAMVVREMVGHGDEVMTEHYSVVSIAEKRSVAETVARQLNPDPPVALPVAPDLVRPGATGRKVQ
ncbi:MAG: site-specific integrase, partial [Myxococcota bacterium]